VLFRSAQYIEPQNVIVHGTPLAYDDR